MKIWYQSASSYGYEPVWDDYGKAILDRCHEVASPGTTVHLAGIPAMIRDIENWRSLQYYQNVQVLQNMRTAQQQGYDAFVIGCTLDVGLLEGRSMLDIPVVGISEASYHLAISLGRLFTFVTSSIAFFNFYEEQIQRYGLFDRYLRGPFLVPASEEEIAGSLKQPAALTAKFVDTAARAADAGASVIIPAPAFYATLAYRAKLAEVRGAVILDTIAVAIKTAEMMAGLYRLNVRPSRQIGVFCKPEPVFEKQVFEKLRGQFHL